MTNPALKDQILKTDSRGRVQTPVERREALLDEFERSGLSGAKFAALVGLKYQTFSAWATRRRKQRQSEQSPPPAKLVEPVPKLQWVEAVVEKEASSSGKGMLSVHLPGGARMEIGDVRQAALAGELLRALGSQRPC